jgi:hypothetical protein
MTLQKKAHEQEHSSPLAKKVAVFRAVLAVASKPQESLPDSIPASLKA